MDTNYNIVKVRWIIYFRSQSASLCLSASTHTIYSSKEDVEEDKKYFEHATTDDDDEEETSCYFFCYYSESVASMQQFQPVWAGQVQS